MKKSKFVYLCLGVIFSSTLYATNIIKAPGSTTDIFTELTIRSSSEADTLFIEGGTGDIYLQAGPTDDGAYSWDKGTGELTTYSIPFSFADATETLEDGSNGRLVSVSRTNPDQTQYVWVAYRSLPIKPTTPIGNSTVCAGTNSTYTATSLNAESYEWFLNPEEAGIISDGTTSEATISWSSLYLGEATITVRGINGVYSSSISDPKTITVSAIPPKPDISGDCFVKMASTSIYTGVSAGASIWTWVLNPASGMATSTPSENLTNLSFADAGTLSLTLQTQNACGTSLLSDAIEIEVFDSEIVPTLISQIDALSIERNSLQTQVDELVADTSEYGLLIHDLNDEVASLLNENTLLMSDNNVLTEDNSNLKIQVADQSAIIDDLSTTNEILTTQNNELNAWVENQKNEIADLQTQIDELITLNSELQLEADILNFTNEYLQSDNDRLTQENEGLTSDNVTLNSTIESQLTELELLRKVYILSWSVESVTTQVFETTVGDFSISLYPNPTPGEVNIICSEIMKSLQILNIQGQVVAEKELNNTSTSFTVNRAEMPVGTYFVRIVTTRGVATHKLIIVP